MSNAKNDTRGPIEHAQSAPVEKAAEASRPKPAPTERPAQPPVVRPPMVQPGRTGSSNRVRARLARLGVQRANPYNPVLEPRVGGVGNDPPQKAETTQRQIERANHGAQRGAPRPQR
ncbi:GTP pyrophosphokinase, partial [Streptomyces puniciscabiei]